MIDSGMYDNQHNPENRWFKSPNHSLNQNQSLKGPVSDAQGSSQKNSGSLNDKSEEKDFFDFHPLDDEPWIVTTCPEDYSFLKIWLLNLALDDPRKVLEKYNEGQIEHYQRLITFIKNETPRKNVKLIGLVEDEKLYSNELYLHEVSQREFINIEREAIYLNRSFKFAEKGGLPKSWKDESFSNFRKWLSNETKHGETKRNNTLEKDIPKTCKAVLNSLDIALGNVSSCFLIRAQLAQLYANIKKELSRT